jgi:hypothetical protein
MTYFFPSYSYITCHFHKLSHVNTEDRGSMKQWYLQPHHTAGTSHRAVNLWKAMWVPPCMQHSANLHTQITERSVCDRLDQTFKTWYELNNDSSTFYDYYLGTNESFHTNVPYLVAV